MLLKQQPEVGKDRHNTLAKCNCAEEQVTSAPRAYMVSVLVGNKIGLTGDNYTQLLSGVREQYRGQGIYRNLTNILSQTSPPQRHLYLMLHTSITTKYNEHMLPVDECVWQIP